MAEVGGTTDVGAPEAEGRGHAEGGAPQLLDADALIDDIIAKKGPYQYTEGLSEDNWEQELEQIPLFMTRSPEAVDPESSPALAALQDIKYQDQNPRDHVLACKEDGNAHFSKRQYKKAVAAYTKGISIGETNCSDPSLLAVLYCNRAAAQFHLGNYGLSLKDATRAKGLKPNHMKALVRGSQVYLQLQRFGEAVEWCDEGLRIEPENAKLRELRTKATREKKRQERDQRKEMLAEKARKAEEQKLLEAIKSKGIRLTHQDLHGSGNEDGLPLDMSTLSLEGPHPSGGRVHLNSEGQLVWPVVLLYPEYGQTDFIAAFNETQRFRDHLEVMFGQESPPWDSEGRYSSSTIELYYEEVPSGNLLQVPLEATLAEVLSTERYCVVSGTPSFIVLAAGSFRNHFLARKI